jgi:hypothetical protein
MVYDVFDLQNFAVDTFNWNGDNEYFLQEKQTQEHGGRHPHKRPALHLDQKQYVTERSTLQTITTADYGVKLGLQSH